MTDLTALRFGFVGTGAITEAVITGMCKTDLARNRIIVSPRNAETAGHLARKFDNVEVAASNQAVIDSADVVFLAVRPQIVEEVVRPLAFRPGQRVISLVSATPLGFLQGWIGVPVTLCHAVPLLFAADLGSATSIYPADPVAEAIFSRLGTAMAAQSRQEHDALVAATCVMGTYFGIQEILSGWLAQKGIARRQANLHLRQLFLNLAKVAMAADDPDFAALRQTFSTRGGLNEQVFADFFKAGAAKALEEAVEAVFARISCG